MFERVLENEKKVTLLLPLTLAKAEIPALFLLSDDSSALLRTCVIERHNDSMHNSSSRPTSCGRSFLSKINCLDTRS